MEPTERNGVDAVQSLRSMESSNMLSTEPDPAKGTNTPSGKQAARIILFKFL
jgi:hypothetical protein